MSILKGSEQMPSPFHYQHEQYFYDMCDREGIVVWAEIPMLAMPDNEEGIRNACEQLRELILQNNIIQVFVFGVCKMKLR